MVGVASVRMLLILILSGFLLGTTGASAADVGSDAYPERCSDTSGLSDNDGAECTIWIPRCTEQPCTKYMLTIIVEPEGDLDAAASGYLTALVGGNQECGGLGGCTATTGPHTASTIVTYGLPCEAWGLDGFVGVHAATSAKVTCERTVV